MKMSDAKEIRFFVEQEVLDAGVKIVFAVMEGIDNRQIDPRWTEERQARIRDLTEKYRDLDVHEDAVLEGFNLLHDHTGVKRRKNIPASENLIRLLKKNGDVFFINTAVDIYNIISMETKLALGAHDIDRVDGNVTLRFTDGSERFQPIGQPEPIPISPHEYSYCDDNNEVLCRLEIRQVEKTKVDEQSSNIFYIVQGNEAVAQEELLHCAEQIICLTSEHCGGTGYVVLPEVV